MTRKHGTFLLHPIMVHRGCWLICLAFNITFLSRRNCLVFYSMNLISFRGTFWDAWNSSLIFNCDFIVSSSDWIPDSEIWVLQIKGLDSNTFEFYLSIFHFQYHSHTVAHNSSLATVILNTMLFSRWGGKVMSYFCNSMFDIVNVLLNIWSLIMHEALILCLVWIIWI